MALRVNSTVKDKRLFQAMNIFINPGDGRPRAGWRIANQLVLFLLLVVGLMLAKNALIPGVSIKLLDALIMGSAGMASVWFAARLIDRRSIKEYGLARDRRWMEDLGAGLALGAVAMMLIFLIELAFGWISITGFGWERQTDIPYLFWFSSYLFAMLIIGFYEELIFRGYQIFNMVEGLHSSSISIRAASAIAVITSSTIFGLLHAANPNAGLISTLNIILAGVMLAVPYLLTGSLAISIGIHISWNFFQGGLFGFAVSGTPFRGSLIQIKQEGARYITGGSFGPEAGLVGIFGIILILGLSVYYINYRQSDLSIHTTFKKELSKSAKQDE